RSMQKEAALIEDPKIRESLLKHAARSESAARIRSMLELAATEPEIACVPDVFDADPWLLNVENGTIDLRTGEIHPPNRENMITKVAPVIFDPRAKAPRWIQFLRDITGGDEELMEYLQLAVGYSLTGDT